MKIGVFGGTFNPVHTGHVRLAGICSANAGLDKLLIIPAATPPHKTAVKIPDDEHRLEMLKIAFADTPNAEISDIELRRGGRSFTIDTLNILRDIYQGDELFLIVGSDMFYTLESWYLAEEIRPLATVLTMAREQNELLKLHEEQNRLDALGWKTVVFEEPPFVASSTEVRSGDLALVPDEIADYVAQNGLYGLDADSYPWDFDRYDKLARETLSEYRYYHSVCVAERAAELALRFGDSAAICRVAGILHDICKETPRELQLQLLSGSDKISDKTFMSQPEIWHGYAAAEYIRRELNIKSRSILNAVRFHTTARAAMSLTEMIVYLSDLTSKDRDYPELEELRAITNESLRDGMITSLSYFRRTLSVFCDETKEAMNYYLGSDDAL